MFLSQPPKPWGYRCVLHSTCLKRGSSVIVNQKCVTRIFSDERNLPIKFHTCFAFPSSASFRNVIISKLSFLTPVVIIYLLYVDYRRIVWRFMTQQCHCGEIIMSFCLPIQVLIKVTWKRIFIRGLMAVFKNLYVKIISSLFIVVHTQDSIQRAQAVFPALFISHLSQGHINHPG